jgi:hypothetical protein
VPAARHEPAEHAVARRTLVEMKRLRVELVREDLDLVGGNGMRPGPKALPDPKIVQAE